MPRDNVHIAMGQRSLRARIDHKIVETGLGFGPYTMHRTCLRRVLALESRSDAELACMGLRREDILSHVFSDLLAS